MILLNNSAGYFAGTQAVSLVEFQISVKLTSLSARHLFLWADASIPVRSFH